MVPKWNAFYNPAFSEKNNYNLKIWRYKVLFRKIFKYRLHIRKRKIVENKNNSAYINKSVTIMDLHLTIAISEYRDGRN